MTTLPDTTLLARGLRLVVVQNQYDLGNLTLAEARKLLSGELTPGNPQTIYNDADQLKIKVAEIMPCGHIRADVVSSGEGTSYCGQCVLDEAEATK